MSVEMACACDVELPPHSHIGEWVREGGLPHYKDTGEIRVWVDWKAVARELAHA